MVEWKKIGDSCITITPPKKLEKELYNNEGPYPIIDQGQKEIVGYTDDKSALIPNGFYTLFGDHTRYVKFHVGQFAQGADGLKILKTIDSVLPRYFFYAFSNTEVPSRGYSRHWSIAKELLIPIPSFQEQNRIVGILDTFTASIDNLKEQIAQRRKQYEYYRDQLLDLEGKEGVEMKLLSSISTIKVGPFGSLIHKKDYVSGGIPLVNPVQMNNGYIVRDDSFSVSEETAKLLESYTLYTGDVVFARRGEIGRCAIVTENESNFICGTGSLIVTFKDIINSKFMLFMFNTPYCKTYLLKSAVGGSMLNINCDIVGKMQIPVPPLSEQQRIVSILDTFEASIQNLEAQLSQREKQYDYYRNKLLTFE